MFCLLKDICCEVSLVFCILAFSLVKEVLKITVGFILCHCCSSCDIYKYMKFNVLNFFQVNFLLG